jgi:hypothetical protein
MLNVNAVAAARDPDSETLQAIRLIWKISLIAAVLIFLQIHLLSTDADQSVYLGIQFFTVLLFIVATFYYVSRVLIHPYVFLLATLGLFIGGRFVALVTIDQPVFSDANFIPIVLSVSESIALMSKISGALMLIHVGVLWAYQMKLSGWVRIPNDAPSPKLALFSLGLLVISAVVSLVGIVQHYAACSEFGYLAIYQDQKTDNLLRLAALGQYGLLLGAGLAFTTPKKWLQGFAILLVTAYFVSYLGIGLRSGFLSLVLMVLWLVHTRVRKLNFFLLMLVPIVMVALAQLAITVGLKLRRQSQQTLLHHPQSLRQYPPLSHLLQLRRNHRSRHLKFLIKILWSLHLSRSAHTLSISRILLSG